MWSNSGQRRRKWTEKTGAVNDESRRTFWKLGYRLEYQVVKGALRFCDGSGSARRTPVG